MWRTISRASQARARAPATPSAQSECFERSVGWRRVWIGSMRFSWVSYPVNGPRDCRYISDSIETDVYWSMAAGSMMKATLDVTWYSTIALSRTTAVCRIRSSPVM